MSSAAPPGSPDVVVLGAGAIGAATAYELALRGARVSVLERAQVGEGCSYGNAGLICPSHADALASPASIRDGIGWLGRRDSPFYVRPRLSLLPWLARFGLAALPRRSAEATACLRSLAAASLERHEQLAAAGLRTGFTRRGILSVFESERRFHDTRERLAHGAAEFLDGAAARRLDPALSETIAGAAYHPSEAHCDPAMLVRGLIDAAGEQGAEIRAGVEVLRLRRSNGRITELDTTAGTLHTGAVVLAAGIWARQLATQLGAFLPLEAAKGYHVELVSTGVAPASPIYMEEARVIATPLDGRLRIAGTLELSGLDLRVDPVRVGALADAARRVLRLAPDTRTAHVWRGLRPCTPDGLPVLGRSEQAENLYLATGHAMLGITLAPVTGQIMAGLVTGETPRHPLEPFSPARFRRLPDVVRRRMVAR
jgi:D-amino-acid dehydrogenase